MICASCGHVESAGSPCRLCGRDPLLGGRYRLERVLGRTPRGFTFRATEVENGRPLIVKVLHAGDRAPTLALSLFDHHARELEHVRHPSVAVHVDHFAAPFAGTTCACLAWVQVPGNDLQRDRPGRQLDTDGLLEFLAETLATLESLHGRTPPVFHGNLKPSNLVHSDTDGRTVLVDFGTIRDALEDPVTHAREGAGVATARRPGRRPPEQEDLRGLALTALALAAPENPPADLEDPPAWARDQGLDLDPCLLRILGRMAGAGSPASAAEHHGAVQDLRWRRKLIASSEQVEPRPARRVLRTLARVLVVATVILGVAADSRPVLATGSPDTAAAIESLALFQAGAGEAARERDPLHRSQALAAIARDLGRARRADLAQEVAHDAARAASQIPAADGRRAARLEVAAAQVAAGDDEAGRATLALALAPLDGEARVRALLAAAEAFRTTGLARESRALLDDAARRGAALEDAPTRLRLLAQVAQALVAAGDDVAAQTLVSRTMADTRDSLDASTEGVRALAIAAVALGEAGDVAGMDRTVARVTGLARSPGQTLRGGALAEVLATCARARLAAGDRDQAGELLTEALGAALTEIAPDARAASLAAIATGLAEEGRPDQALLVARQLPQPWRDEAVLAGVRALLRTGQRREAQEQARTMGPRQGEAVAEVAISYADAWKAVRHRGAGGSEYLARQALMLSHSIGSPGLRGQVLAAVALRAAPGAQADDR